MTRDNKLALVGIVTCAFPGAYFVVMTAAIEVHAIPAALMGSVSRTTTMAGFVAPLFTVPAWILLFAQGSQMNRAQALVGGIACSFATVGVVLTFVMLQRAGLLRLG